MRASRVGLDSTYIAVVLMLVWPAICAIAFRSTPRSAGADRAWCAGYLSRAQTLSSSDPDL
jgi:hypothetical protein